jgi:hypothetical protein
MAVNPISQRYPFELRDQSPEVVQAHRYAFQGIVDLNQAIASLKSQITNLSPVSTVAISSTTGSGGSVPVPTPFPFPGLGSVRDETGSTSYTPIGTDNGILIVFNDASPVAVTLDSAVAAPYWFFATNFGAGIATLTPTTGTINGGASYALPQNYFAMVVFDGTNWKTSAEVLPQTFSAISHEWLKDYDAVTGLFTASQPAFADISGVATPAQIGTGTPAAGDYVDGGTGAWTALPSIPVVPSFADNETPGGTIGGGNVTFTLAHAPSPAGSLILSLGGLVQWQNVAGDYTLSGSTITFATAPTSGPLVAWYRF